MKPPLFKALGDTYAFHWIDAQIDLVMDRLHESRGGDLTAEVEVRCHRDETNQLLHHARLNLISTRSRQEIIRSLAGRIPESEFQWSDALEQACFKAIQRWREGDPVVDLRCVQLRTGSRFLLEPYIEYAGPTVLFADGGVGKSLFGMAIAVSIASGVPTVGNAPADVRPALYLDWEADDDTHARRMRAICAGMNVDVTEARVHYRRQYASLAEAAPHIRKQIAELGIGFVVIDSLGAARGGEPESADSTIRLFNAARSLMVPWLGIDHIGKADAATGQAAAKPFGSIYTHHLSRLTWAGEKVEDFGNGHLIIALSNQKVNNGRPLGRRGYDVEFREDADQNPTLISYRSKSVQDIPGMFARQGQPQQIAEVLRANNRSMLVEDIERALEASGSDMTRDQIRVCLNKHKSLFVVVPDGGRATLWGLRAEGH